MYLFFYKTFYDLLGVSENATKEQIKTAYRKKAKELHPDRYPAFKGKTDREKENYEQQKEDNTELFTQVSLAYKILLNDQKRIEYDNYVKKYSYWINADIEPDTEEQKKREIEKEIEEYKDEKQKYTDFLKYIPEDKLDVYSNIVQDVKYKIKRADKIIKDLRATLRNKQAIEKIKVNINDYKQIADKAIKLMRKNRNDKNKEATDNLINVFKKYISDKERELERRRLENNIFKNSYSILEQMFK